jgi:hypothetical protein
VRCSKLPAGIRRHAMKQLGVSEVCSTREAGVKETCASDLVRGEPSRARHVHDANSCLFNSTDQLRAAVLGTRSAAGVPLRADPSDGWLGIS